MNKFSVMARCAVALLLMNITVCVGTDAQARDLTAQELQIFSQNDILFYDPGECILKEKTNSSTLEVTGDLADIMNAKNAEKSFFDGSGNIDAPKWSDSNKASMKKLLENYGDLAYRLGKAVGAPYVAILVQMRYEDSNSVCGKNNFWGNGCPPSRAYRGGATIQGENLGEGFVQYGQTLLKICEKAQNVSNEEECLNSLRVSDPKTYLTRIGPLWVQGDANGAGYGSIEAQKKSVDALQAYIDSDEGQEIVKTFGGGSGASETASATVDTTTSGTGSGTGGCDFTKYNYSDEDLKRLAAIAASENGDNIESLKNEMSLMANLYESSRGSKYSSVLDYVLNGGWFGSGKKGISGDNASSEQFAAAKDVFNNGNRTLPKEVDEHDCIDCGRYGYDITKIEIDGKTITSQDGLKDASNYVKNKTILHNKDGATYTFYTWANPDNPVKSDPMGYTGDSVACEPGGNNCSGSVALKDVKDYPQYKQQTGHTCGPTSMAMLVSYGSGKEVTENDIISVIGGDRVYVGGDRVTATKKVCEEYGCEAKQIESTEDAIRAALKDGWMVHYSGSGDGSSYATNPFGSSAGHYVGLFGIDDDDQVVVANSAYQGNKKMSLHDAVKGHKGLPTMAIKFANAGGGVCEEIDYCEGGDEDSDASGASGDVAALQELVKKWAWPEYKGRGFTQRMPEYADAISQGGYSGSCNGVDCAAFVYQLITRSGWDPDFPTGPVRSMISALENSSTWQEVTSDIKSNSDARPGDVIIKYAGGAHHVVIYVGDIDGFESPIASASRCDRAPMADRSKDITSYIGQGYHVFRKK